MANQFDVTPLGGFNLGAGIQQLGQTIERRQEQEELEGRRKQIQDLAVQAAGGDAGAIEKLFGLSPQLAMNLEERNIMKQRALGQEQAELSKQAETDWGLRWQQAQTEEEFEALEQEALQNPLIDFDESDLGIRGERANLAVNTMLYQNLGKDAYRDLIGGGIDPAKRAELDIKREANRLRGLEVEQRNLDRAISRETNELKRQELEAKLTENQKKREQAEKDRKASAQGVISSFDNTLATIDKIETSPGFGSAVGARIPFIDALPGSDAQETIGLIETLQSQTFLNEVSKMRGLGALSEAEGRKLSAAIGSLNRDMSEDAFRRSLNDIKGYINKAKSVAADQYGVKIDEPTTKSVNWEDL
jgi:Rad3-related DNA helicase